MIGSRRHSFLLVLEIVSFVGILLSFRPFTFAATMSTPAFPFTSRVWQTEDGLPQDAVRAMAQTADGYLWFGTTEGVARFDGLKFSIFNPRNTPELKGYSITALCALPDGSLWIGTTGPGLTRFKDGRFSHYGEKEGIPAAGIQMLASDKLGNLWIATAVMLIYFKDNQFVHINHNWGLADDNITALCESSIGTIIGTANGLSFFTSAKVEAKAEANLFPGYWITAVHEDAGGQVWIGTRDRGLIRFKNNNVKYFTQADGLRSDAIRSIYADGNGVVWVGSNGGLNRFVNGELVTESANSAYSAVFSIFQDREANVWIGADEGLVRLTPSPLFSYTTENGLLHNRVLSLCEDQQGAVWMATWGGGLIRFHEGKFSQTTTKDGLISDFLPTVLSDRTGRLWLGTINKGVACQTDGRWTHYTSAHGLPNLTMRTIYQDRHDAIWIGTENGLARWQTNGFIAFTNEPSLLIRAIAEERDGSLWLGTPDGLWRFQNGLIQRDPTSGSLTNQPILSLHVDDDNVLWVGTDRAGLYRSQNGHWTSYTTLEGLFNDTIFQIQEDHGKLWMSCRHGVFSVSKTDLNECASGRRPRIVSRVYDKSDGMASSQGVGGNSQPAGCKTRDGKLWFAMSKGVVAIDAKAAGAVNSISPPVVIEEVVFDKKTVSEQVGKWVGGNLSLTRSPTHPLTLPPSRGELEFHYTALSYSAPEKNQFKYKLEGFDSDWLDAGTRRIAYYNNLPPGSYIFRVIACNNDGVWNALGASVKFSLQPHLWQTWWFKSLVVLAGLSLVATGARFATKRRMQLRLERLEQQHAIEKERTRIAQDMHDDLGARLTEILLLTRRAGQNDADTAEIKSLVGKIAHTSGEIIDNLHAIVWAVNPRNDSLDNLATYIQTRAPSFLKLSSIRCRFEIPDELPNRPLPAEVRHNLFLVIKEALNNVVKHSGASEVWLRLRVEESWLCIGVEDNGQGFDRASSVVDSGNGLQNMQSRMETIGGQFAISSDPGKGTRIKLKILLNQPSSN